MPAITDLNTLAADRDYAAAVRTATRQLIEVGALGDDVRHALPLLTYGPRQAGSILRLPYLLRALDHTRLPDRLLGQLVGLAARIPE